MAVARIWTCSAFSKAPEPSRSIPALQLSLNPAESTDTILTAVAQFRPQHGAAARLAKSLATQAAQPRLAAWARVSITSRGTAQARRQALTWPVASRQLTEISR